MSLKKYKMYINGEWVESESGEYFPSYNPATVKLGVKSPKVRKKM